MKEGWIVKKLGEVCEILNGRNQKKVEDINGKYPIYGSGGIMGYANEYICLAGTTIIGRKGSINKPLYVNTKFWNVDTAFGLQPKECCHSRFLYYLCKSIDFTRYDKGVTIPSLVKSDLLQIPISIPSLEEQTKIVEELDQLSNIIEKQRQQLSELDNLAQSIFYDMFGDPVTNEKDWNVKTFGEEFEISSGGTPDTKNRAYWDNGTISWIGSNLCQNIVLYNNDCKFITDLGFEKSSTKKYYPGYVLVALVGATIGKVALLKFETTTNQNVAGINVPKNESFTSEFVFYLLQQLYCMFEAVGGDKFKMANLKFIRSLPLILPPLSLQQLFAQKIEAIEQEKEIIKQSIAETEELFNSRMDYYFNS